MQPQQPPYTPGPGPIPQNTGQYDFIMGNNHRPTSGLFGTGNSLKTRIAVVAGGGLLLLVIAIIFAAILSNVGGSNNADVLTALQRQAELARISQSSATLADEQSTQNFAATLYASLSSEQTTFMRLLAANGAKPSASKIAARHNSQTDTALDSAKTSGTYDETYLTIAKSQLTEYVQSLRQAYASAPSANEKQIIQDAYDQAQLLVAMSAQP